MKIKCFNEETFGDENIGSASVNLEGLAEGSIKDVWIPLERVSSGELRLQIEVVRVDDQEGSRVSFVTKKSYSVKYFVTAYKMNDDIAIYIVTMFLTHLK